MFVDKVKIYIKAGDGGNGQKSFRREKYVPEGGPSGGDGGKGADIIFIVDEGLRTLLDFRYQKHFKADRGEHGRTKAQHGAKADDMIVRIPPGTVIIDDDTKEIIADLTRNKQQVVVAKGGRGGRGNMRFATSVNPAPDIAEKGEPGQERYIILELKVMADVGLTGFPSVGKSTLLDTVSKAKPKIADYHFTTLAPNLGVVEVDDGRSFVMADLPGLIEGAHLGAGLGHQFLRHIERTRIVVHVVDMAATEGREPYDDWVKINRELESYKINLMERPQIIVANKMDIPEGNENLLLFKQKVGDEYPIFSISAATGSGIKELLYAIADELDKIPFEPIIDDVDPAEEKKIYKYISKDVDTFTIRKENEIFVLESPKIEKLFVMTNFDQYDSMMRFARILRKMGVDKRLRELGAKNGDSVSIGQYEFEFVEN
ncbi:MAG: GTPase ObgE [Vulcanibacillus sp.]